MEHASKHVVVPVEVLERLKGTNNDATSGGLNAHTLDGELSTLMQRKGVDDYEKALLYQEALKKYLAFRKQNRAPFKIDIVDKSQPVVRPPGEPKYHDDESSIEHQAEEMYDVTNILNAIPKSYRQKANQILDIIKQRPDIMSWNKQNELVYNNDVIQGSNVTDLLYETVRSMGKSLQPVGWSKFLQGLARVNVPEYLVGSQKNRSLLQGIKTDGMEDLDVKLSSPSKPRRSTVKRKGADQFESHKRVTWERF